MMDDLMREDMENDAFLDKVYGRREDEEDEQPDWQLATLEDLDEQQQMEITAAAMPKPMGRAASIVWDIRVEPIPASPGYYAWVPEHEERFGVAHGDTPETAVASMREWIEFKTEVA
jgi:predicted RNase H-like HicB family nuclease